jgi:hypothetical protein
MNMLAIHCESTLITKLMADLRRVAIGRRIMGKCSWKPAPQWRRRGTMRRRRRTRNRACHSLFFPFDHQNHGQSPPRGDWNPVVGELLLELGAVVEEDG